VADGGAQRTRLLLVLMRMRLVMAGVTVVHGVSESVERDLCVSVVVVSCSSVDRSHAGCGRLVRWPLSQTNRLKDAAATTKYDHLNERYDHRIEDPTTLMWVRSYRAFYHRVHVETVKRNAQSRRGPTSQPKGHSGGTTLVTHHTPSSTRPRQSFKVILVTMHIVRMGRVDVTNAPCGRTTWSVRCVEFTVARSRWALSYTAIAQLQVDTIRIPTCWRRVCMRGWALDAWPFVNLSQSLRSVAPQLPTDPRF
jgi:hypothetical protein